MKKKIDDFVLDRPFTFMVGYAAFMASLGASFNVSVLPLAVAAWAIFFALLVFKK